MLWRLNTSFQKYATICLLSANAGVIAVANAGTAVSLVTRLIPSSIAVIFYTYNQRFLNENISWAAFPVVPALRSCMSHTEEVRDMQEFFAAVGNVGFPMAVTAFLLVRIESRLGALNDSIQLLIQTIARK